MMSRYDEPGGHEDLDDQPGWERPEPAREASVRRSVNRRRLSRGAARPTGRRAARGGSGGGGRRLTGPAAGGGWSGDIFRRHPVASVLALVLTVVLTGTTLTAYGMYRAVWGSIHRDAIPSSALGNRPPELVPGALNILLIGSDSRAGTKGRYGATTGPNAIQGSRSDTAMVLHISPDHRHAMVISFPRDSLVPIYGCQNDGQGHPGQQAQPGQTEALNWTFSFGGVACLWKTIEQTTRIHIDDFAEVDFSGFKKIVNDLGGIKVCLPFAIDNAQAGLHLPAGVQTVMGAQALAFVRLRENIGQGTDLQRIQRQQYFLASALQKAKHSSLFTDYSVVRDAASALTTSMSLTKMLALANGMRGLSTNAIQFITVPWAYDAVQTGRVDWVEPQADQLFSAVRHDTQIPRSVSRAARSSGKSKAKAKPVPAAAPSQVTVQVLNGTTTTGLAGTASTALTRLGFTVTSPADAPTSNYTTSYIEYGSSAQLPQVNALAKEVPGAKVKRVRGMPTGTLTLILGSTFTQVGQKSSASASPSVSGLARSYGGITANANICSDQQAFAGPNSP